MTVFHIYPSSTLLINTFDFVHLLDLELSVLLKFYESSKDASQDIFLALPNWPMHGNSLQWKRSSVL